MTTACIVQARVASTRLPAKVLKEVAGEPVLGHVLRRCRAIPGIDTVVCATVDSAECEPIEALAERYGVKTFRGSETDVLARYLGAARAVDADAIMRVTSDCPLIDPGLCADVLTRRAREDADYAANNFVYGYPHGLDCEVFTRQALEDAAVSARDPYEREHVSPWIRNRPDLNRVSVSGPGGARAKWRWTLDYPEDLDFLLALFEFLPPPPAMPCWESIAAVIDGRPELALVNHTRWQR